MSTYIRLIICVVNHYLIAQKASARMEPPAFRKLRYDNAYPGRSRAAGFSGQSLAHRDYPDDLSGLCAEGGSFVHGMSEALRLAWHNQGVQYPADTVQRQSSRRREYWNGMERRWQDLIVITYPGLLLPDCERALPGVVHHGSAV